MQFIGTLTEEYKKIDMGYIFSPEDIINRMKTGNYLASYDS